MKNIVVFASPSQDGFHVKLVSCFAFASASCACCLIKTIAISYNDL